MDAVKNGLLFQSRAKLGLGLSSVIFIQVTQWNTVFKASILKMKGTTVAGRTYSQSCSPAHNAAPPHRLPRRLLLLYMSATKAHSLLIKSSVKGRPGPWQVHCESGGADRVCVCASLVGKRREINPALKRADKTPVPQRRGGGGVLQNVGTSHSSFSTQKGGKLAAPQAANGHHLNLILEWHHHNKVTKGRRFQMY